MLPNTELKHFLTPAAREIQIYINSPSQFIIDQQRQLLPTWDNAIANVVIILQKSRFSLDQNHPKVIEEKNFLREQFLRFGCNLIFQLRDAKDESDLFDPRCGFPLISTPGKMILNDNAVVNALLGFSLSNYQHCSLLSHPQWGTAIYPATIVSTASWTKLESALLQLTAQKGWKPINKKC